MPSQAPALPSYSRPKRLDGLGHPEQATVQPNCCGSWPPRFTQAITANSSTHTRGLRGAAVSKVRPEGSLQPRRSFPINPSGGRRVAPLVPASPGSKPSGQATTPSTAQPNSRLKSGMKPGGGGRQGGEPAGEERCRGRWGQLWEGTCRHRLQGKPGRLQQPKAEVAPRNLSEDQGVGQWRATQAACGPSGLLLKEALHLPPAPGSPPIPPHCPSAQPPARWLHGGDLHLLQCWTLRPGRRLRRY